SAPRSWRGRRDRRSSPRARTRGRRRPARDPSSATRGKSSLSAPPMLLQVTRAAAVTVRRGHPWVYRDAIVRPPKRIASGDAVELTDERGEFLGYGLWDASSPIAARIFSRDRAAQLDERTLGDAIERALRSRDRLFGGDPETNAYRLCNGEGDRVPG